MHDEHGSTIDSAGPGPDGGPASVAEPHPADLLARSDDIDVFDTSSILPPPPEGAVPLLHDREYRVQAYRLAPDRVLIQGAVRDQKPPHLYVPGDVHPLTVHHMQLGMTISFPDLTIVDVQTQFESHPNDVCPSIIDHYDNLVGLSIARGFTHKVRELFGGPRGCTHTTALLQAMAPIAMQIFWSMRSVTSAEAGEPYGVGASEPGDDSWKRILNTCHVWAEDGEMIQARKAGQRFEGVPLFIRKHREKHGMD